MSEESSLDPALPRYQEEWNQDPRDAHSSWTVPNSGDYGQAPTPSNRIDPANAVPSYQPAQDLIERPPVSQNEGLPDHVRRETNGLLSRLCPSCRVWISLGSSRGSEYAFTRHLGSKKCLENQRRAERQRALEEQLRTIDQSSTSQLPQSQTPHHQRTIVSEHQRQARTSCTSSWSDLDFSGTCISNPHLTRRANLSQDTRKFYIRRRLRFSCGQRRLIEYEEQAYTNKHS